ncbi:glycosyltransferase family 2 protein [Neoroseomonas lacus]|nr:glycosyltransferase family A protein [Neoroseomonas lacus]
MMQFSIVICTRNRAEDLAHTLRSLTRLHIPEGIEGEVVVVDNGSTDRTPEVIAEARRYLPFPLVSAVERERGTGAGRNRGLRLARGEIIAWTDDDCRPARSWLREILSAFEADEELDLLGGRIELYDRGHLPLTIKTSRRIEVMDDATYPGAILMNCNMAQRRRLVERIGGFDVRFGAGSAMRAGEDADYVLRAHRAGCRVVYLPQIVVFHDHKRVTLEQGDAVVRNYHFSDSALLMKTMFGGDRLAVRWYYWRLSRLFSDLVRSTGSMTELRRQAVFLSSFLAGSLRYVIASMRVKRTAGPRTGEGAPGGQRTQGH